MSKQVTLAESPAPKLNTSLIAPLQDVSRQMSEQCEVIQAWFSQQWQLTIPPVYGSVDLRNAGFKLAPVDMNLFPAGFNNLNPNFLPLSIQAAKKIIQQFVSEAKNILIIPEDHTRNLKYWENIATLQQILQQAGFVVRFGSLTLAQPFTIDLPTQQQILIEVLQRQGDTLMLSEFRPDLVLLNNDLSNGIPAILQQLDQVVVPPAQLGWSHRLKSAHFQYYAEVTAEFAQHFSIDPWLITPLFRYCGYVNFMQQEGMDCIVHHAESLFADVKRKYAEYQISHAPFLIVKADAGTYGMAVMTVRDVNELVALNRKQRTRMSTTKGGQLVDRVIIQEGVYTFETVGTQQAVAEPVVYLWGDTVVGGFYRIHEQRGVDENLNAPGMQFEPLPFTHTCQSPHFYLYGIVAQLSMLAAAREMKDEIKI